LINSYRLIGCCFTRETSKPNLDDRILKLAAYRCPHAGSYGNWSAERNLPTIRLLSAGDYRMTETTVTIASAGLRLAGTLRVPDKLPSGERRAAFLVLHGFGSNRSSSNVLAPSKVLGELGYVTLAFDMRGCGESEGEHGRVICLEQVEDTSIPNASG
jgi:pimeloyl-ACP methyl ester carboxylesterase